MQTEIADASAAPRIVSEAKRFEGYCEVDKDFSTLYIKLNFVNVYSRSVEYSNTRLHLGGVIRCD